MPVEALPLYGQAGAQAGIGVQPKRMRAQKDQEADEGLCLQLVTMHFVGTCRQESIDDSLKSEDGKYDIANPELQQMHVYMRSENTFIHKRYILAPAGTPA